MIVMLNFEGGVLQWIGGTEPVLFVEIDHDEDRVSIYNGECYSREEMFQDIKSLHGNGYKFTSGRPTTLEALIAREG